MKTLSTALFLILLMSPIQAVANCEIAPFGYHTIAVYGATTASGDRLVAYSIYGKDLFIGSLDDESNIEYIYGEITTAGTKPFKIRYRTLEFILSKEKIDTVKLETELSPNIRLPQSIIDITSLPKHGYARYDAAMRTLWLSSTLEIMEEDKPRNGNQEVILKDIIEQNIFLDQRSDNPISKSNILNTRLIYTVIGKATNNFNVITAHINITGLDKLITSSISSQLKDRSAELQAIYFQRANTKPFYIADSRDYKCGSEKLSQGVRNNDKYLGAIGTFKVTGAYDITNDGMVDIVEINEALSYYIAPSGQIVVISRPKYND